MQLPEDPGAALDEGLDLEVLLPDRPVPQVLGQAGAEQVGRLEEVPVGRDNKVLLRQLRLPAETWFAACANLSREAKPTGRYIQCLRRPRTRIGQKEQDL